MSSYNGDYYYAQSDDDYSDRFDSDRYDYDHYDNSYDGEDGGGHEGYDDGYDTGRQDDHEAAQDDANAVPARRHDSDSSDSSDSDDERLAYYFRRYAPTGTPSASDPIAAQPQHHVDRSQQAPVSENRWNSEARQRPRASGASALIFGFEDNPLPFYSAPGWPHPDSRSPHAPHPTPLPLRLQGGRPSTSAPPFYSDNPYANSVPRIPLVPALAPSPAPSRTPSQSSTRVFVSRSEYERFLERSSSDSQASSRISVSRSDYEGLLQRIRSLEAQLGQDPDSNAASTHSPQSSSGTIRQLHKKSIPCYRCSDGAHLASQCPLLLTTTSSHTLSHGPAHSPSKPSAPPTSRPSTTPQASRLILPLPSARVPVRRSERIRTREV